VIRVLTVALITAISVIPHPDRRPAGLAQRRTPLGAVLTGGTASRVLALGISRAVRAHLLNELQDAFGVLAQRSSEAAARTAG
jgi:hypothetical protein